jgi:hypothetical protein
MSVVRIERIDRRRAGECGASGACAPAAEQHPRFRFAAAELRCRVVVDDLRRAGTAARRGNADQVEQAALCLCDDIRWQVGKRQSLNKCRNIRGDPGIHRRIALVFRH